MFKKFFYSLLVGTVGARIVGIIFALKGYGIWALIVAHLFDISVDALVVMFTIFLDQSYNFLLKD